MIKTLRIKFIALSMLAVLVLLAVIVAAMNITNYNRVVSEADEVLAVLSENHGSFPQFGGKRDDQFGPGMMEPPEDMEGVFEAMTEGMEGVFDGMSEDVEGVFDGVPEDMEGVLNGASEDMDDMLDAAQEDMDDLPDDQDDFREDIFERRNMSPETPYESRFFSVLLDADGNASQTEISRIKAVDESTAVAYAQTVFQTGKQKGFLENYRYIRCEEDDGTRIIFLDYGRKLAASNNFMLISILMALAGYVVFFFVIVFFSKRMIRPVVESYEKQKRFITDAGHEIKTPLTIIKADADILEMDIGENEWLQDITKQTARLTDLTNDLIFLAKTEEPVDTTQLIDFPLSDIVEEVALSFQGPAKTQNKQFEMDIQPMISLTGDEKKIGQLVGILLDNALKYSPENGRISLKLEKQNKSTVLTVYNDTIDPISKDNLSQMFDRFYRMDASRNSKTGGYGIGLSMAKAIVEAHGGKIQAKTDDGKSLKMIVTL